MRLATFRRAGSSRGFLAASLPGDPTRVVDLGRVEEARLRRLGEGRPEGLARVLVPSRLGDALEAGPRVWVRVRQALAYADKWHRRGDLPEALAPSLRSLEAGPCLPEPSGLRRWDGQVLDLAHLRGPGAALEAFPQATLAAVGQHGGRPAGFCLALIGGTGVVLGTWLESEPDWDGALELRIGRLQRRAPLSAWEGLALGPLAPGEVVLLPPPRLRPLPPRCEAPELELRGPFDRLRVSLGVGLPHPTVQ